MKASRLIWMVVTLAVALLWLWVEQPKRVVVTKPSDPAVPAESPAKASLIQTPIVVVQKNNHVGPQQPERASVSRRPISEEIRDSDDLMAMYEMYRNSSDESGEFAYYLAAALGDCPSYIEKTMDRLQAETNSTAPTAASARQLDRQVQRCRRFGDWGTDSSSPLYALIQELRGKAEAANNPKALAQSLTSRLRRSGAENADALAISLLSNGPSGEVIAALPNYLSMRNGSSWLQRDGAPPRDVWGAAWMLLQCDFGGDCGPRSRYVTVTCIRTGSCDLPGMEEALLAATRITPARLQEASRLRDELTAAIRNRDWEKLGFSAEPALGKNPRSR